MSSGDRALQIDWLCRQLSLEMLVPEVYAEWRPLVRDAFVFVAANLSEPRWRQKLAQQLALPAAAPAPLRLLALIEKMPALQKVGQILARNPHLDPDLTDALSRLENEIADATPAELRAVLTEELGERLERFGVEVETRPLAEASVAAVVGFRWRPPDAEVVEKGVFKILKPGIADLLGEDLGLLSALAEYLDAQRGRYGLRHVRIGEFFADVRTLLEGEVDFAREQRALVAAAQRYRKLAGIDVPAAIPELSSGRVTAMERVRGVKVTELRTAPRTLRRRAGERLLQGLLIAPLLAEEEAAVFHADPHAGNLLWDAERDRLVILDWSLTDALSGAERRHLLCWTAAVGLRDERLAWRALRALCGTEFDSSAAEARLRSALREELARLGWIGTPDDRDWLRVLDRVARAGARLARPLVMLRKTLFTLDGVLASMQSPATLFGALVGLRAPAHLPLQPGDWLGLAWSTTSLPTRTAWRFNERVWKGAWDALGAVVFRDRPDSV